MDRPRLNASPELLARASLTLRQRAEAPSKSYTPHEPYEKQKQFLELDCLEALYGGAAGGGKSDALLMAALQYVHVPGYSAILLRRTYADLALPGAIMDRAHDWLADTNARWNDREKTWIFPSGATLSFGYLANTRDHYRYQGSEFQFVGFDELTQFLESQYRYLFSRLRRLHGVDVPLRMRAGTNPGGIGHDWVKTRFIHSPGKRVFVPAKLTDNPHIDQEAYRTSLDELDAATKLQLLEGLWVRDSTGLVYKLNPERNVIDKLPKLPNNEEWITVLGIDYGNVDATALTVLSFTKHRREVFVRKSQAWTSLAPSDAADIVKKWEEHYKFDRIVGDVGGLGKGYAAEAQKRWGLPIKAAQKNDKLGYIKLFNGALEKGEIVIVGKYNEELIAEMGALMWKDDRQLAEHPSMSNHLCFVAGTLVQTETGPRPIETIKRGDKVWTRLGLRRVVAAGPSGAEPTYRLTTDRGDTVTGTANHPIFTTRGKKPLVFLTQNDMLGGWENTDQAKQSFTPGSIIADILNPIGETCGNITPHKEASACTGCCGKKPAGKFRRVITFITEMVIRATMQLKTWCVFLPNNMQATTLASLSDKPPQGSQSKRRLPKRPNGMRPKKVWHGIVRMVKSPGAMRSLAIESALSAARRFNQRAMPMFAVQIALPSDAERAESMIASLPAVSAIQNSQEIASASPSVVPCRVTLVEATGCVENVYNLSVADVHEYFAGGILVSNCDSTLYSWRETYAWHYEPRVKPPEPGSDAYYKALEDDIDWEDGDTRRGWYEA